MSYSETCSCGASITLTNVSTFGDAIERWRRDHVHRDAKPSEVLTELQAIRVSLYKANVAAGIEAR